MAPRKFSSSIAMLMPAVASVLLTLIAVAPAGVDALPKCDVNCQDCRLFDHEAGNCNVDEDRPCQEGWHCIKCKPDYALWVDGCFATCPAGTYRYGYECLPC